MKKQSLTKEQGNGLDCIHRGDGAKDVEGLEDSGYIGDDY